MVIRITVPRILLNLGKLGFARVRDLHDFPIEGCHEVKHPSINQHGTPMPGGPESPSSSALVFLDSRRDPSRPLRGIRE